MTSPDKAKAGVEGTLAAAFEYLDDLRESGVTNMFGAPEYVEAEFDFDEATARAVTSAWMRTFGDGGTPEARAIAAQARGLDPLLEGGR